MKITLTRNAGGHDKGATIDRDQRVAQLLIANGAAIEAKHDNAVTSDDASSAEPKPKQTRRSASRNVKSVDAHDAKGAGKPAGQRGGGVPPSSAAPTAG